MASSQIEKITPMRGLRIYQIVMYLKSVEFFHDTFDVVDDVESVLAAYDICEDFSDAEIAELRSELFKMAQQLEFQEVVRIALNARFSRNNYEVI